jgi:hypothetical protein
MSGKRQEKNMMRYRHIAASTAGFALAACATDQPAEPRQHSAARVLTDFNYNE